MAEAENSCRFIRIKGNWDVGRFGRVIFLREILRLTLFAQDDDAGRIVIFSRESTTLRRPLPQAYIYFIASVKPLAIGDDQLFGELACRVRLQFRPQAGRVDYFRVARHPGLRRSDQLKLR